MAQVLNDNPRKKNIYEMLSIVIYRTSPWVEAEAE